MWVYIYMYREREWIPVLHQVKKSCEPKCWVHLYRAFCEGTLMDHVRHCQTIVWHPVTRNDWPCYAMFTVDSQEHIHVVSCSTVCISCTIRYLIRVKMFVVLRVSNLGWNLSGLWSKGQTSWKGRPGETVPRTLQPTRTDSPPVVMVVVSFFHGNMATTENTFSCSSPPNMAQVIATTNWGWPEIWPFWWVKWWW